MSVTKKRAVCVIAHIDHGKTSFCDHFVASSGFISKKLAGSSRVLDSRKDEQDNLITIQSSCLTLTLSEDETFTLIDSPGHRDFSNEVDTSLYLCEGALLIVDAVEGLQAQTCTVLEQAIRNHLTVILVINKVDRLFSELQLDENGVILHINKILEAINAELDKKFSSIFRNAKTAENKNRTIAVSKFKFNNGNVILASAVHGWAISAYSFVPLVKKLVSDSNSNKNIISYLWDNYAIQNREFIKTKSNKNIATTIIATTIKKLYQMQMTQSSVEQFHKLCEKFDITFTNTMEKTLVKTNTKNYNVAVLQNLFPLFDNTLRVIKELIPLSSARNVFTNRQIMATKKSAENVNTDKNLKETLIPVDELITDKNSFLLGLTTKFLFIDNNRKFIIGDELSQCSNEYIICPLIKLVSGVLRCGDNVCFYGCPVMYQVDNMFKLIGSSLLELTSATAGDVVCISVNAPGYDNLGCCYEIFKGIKTYEFTTITQDPVEFKLPLRYSKQQCNIKFYAFPNNLSDWQEFEKGLKRLELSDRLIKVVKCKTQSAFEIYCIGYLHLQKIKRELGNVYSCSVKITTSNPSVSLRETIVNYDIQKLCTKSLQSNFPPWSNKTNTRIKPIALERSGDYLTTVQAIPLPDDILQALLGSDFKNNTINYDYSNELERQSYLDCSTMASKIKQSEHYRALKQLVDSNCKTSTDLLLANVSDDSVSMVFFPSHSLSASEGYSVSNTDIGKRKIKTNDQFTLHDLNVESNLHNNDNDYLSKCDDNFSYEDEDVDSIFVNDILSNGLDELYLSYVSRAFLTNIMFGPLCHEPVMGVIYVFLCLRSIKSNDFLKTGSLVSLCHRAMQNALLTRGCIRIFEPFSKLIITCSQQNIGSVLTSIDQSRGDILSQDVRDYTYEWVIKASVPVVEIEKLLVLLTTSDSGYSNVTEISSCWMLNNEDPYPSLSAETNEHFSKVKQHNVSRLLIETVRKNKALPTSEKLITGSSDKQRTMARM